MSIQVEAQRLKELCILVVEDDDDGRAILTNYLKPYVKYIYEAADGAEAIEIIKTKKPDIVVTDIMMPGVNGIELIEKLKKLFPGTPFIFITASKEREILLKVIESRPSSFLTKPINTKALLKAIAECGAEITHTDNGKTILRCGALLDTKNRTITYEGRTTPLTNKEFEFLKLLLEAKGSILSYELIEKTIWADNGESMSEGALKNVIYRIRQKSCKSCISTIAKLGVKESAS
jgi:DNA-binding response OmpR family regulator